MNDFVQEFNLLNPWFDNLPYEWSQLKDYGERVTFKKHEIIFSQNEVGSYLYIIESGRVRLFLISPSGEEKALSIIGKNGILGECSLNGDSSYATNAITASEVVLLRISKQSFIEFLSKQPQYIYQTIDLITKKYRLLCSQSLQLSYMKSLPRVCAAFIQLSIQYGEIVEEKQVKLTINFTHQELANLLGTTRVTIAKNIKWLEDQKYIVKKGKSYLIYNIDELAELANEKMLFP
ncbi:Crp/Fnr family transcriptional regulator [Bacillus luteolus]|uniref:Crp/Fnr family transcriptional regulator n=1 Tax=Litchfieldia luteola TaxID=682179 RepID=A0ABR9QJ55_9BACI|nr:Crp/Fnr family transcriptional regulator [Cytobacillus luteolus]MBE4908531.1 Crp/Fnr family transcriptional regulator [Cytobacillus luteolus]MBP1941383.1 CRP-like cAMP-binding protein [Cytobacillus luteolus]